MLSENYLSLPNFLTAGRILSAPVVICCLYYSYNNLAFWFFFIAGLTDWLDGLTARFYHQESYFGQIFDPLADKILIVSVSWALMFFDQLPLWLGLFIISRDILILIGSIVVKIKNLPLNLKPLFISKINTCLQIGVCLCILAKICINETLLEVNLFLSGLFYATLVTTILSGFAYAKLFYESFRKS